MIHYMCQYGIIYSNMLGGVIQYVCLCLYLCVYLSDIVFYGKQCNAFWRQGDLGLEFKTEYWCIVGLCDVAKLLRLPRTRSSHHTYPTYLLLKIIGRSKNNLGYIFLIKALIVSKHNLWSHRKDTELGTRNLGILSRSATNYLCDLAGRCLK